MALFRSLPAVRCLLPKSSSSEENLRRSHTDLEASRVVSTMALLLLLCAAGIAADTSIEILTKTGLVWHFIGYLLPQPLL
jgi:hypothetical protein